MQSVAVPASAVNAFPAQGAVFVQMVPCGPMPLNGFFQQQMMQQQVIQQQVQLPQQVQSQPQKLNMPNMATSTKQTSNGSDTSDSPRSSVDRVPTVRFNTDAVDFGDSPTSWSDVAFEFPFNKEDADSADTNTTSAPSSAASVADETESEADEPAEICPRRFSSSVNGRVWQLSQNAVGCRLVQTAFGEAPCEEARRELAQELETHVAKAVRCPHANHVLQRCIALMRPESLQFMIDELMARPGLAAQAARHRYGCRIVQQLLHKCSHIQVRDFAKVLIDDAVILSCHSFGNFAVQALLEVGTPEHRHLLVRTVERNVRTIGRSTPGASVVAAALRHAADDDSVWIARAVAQELEILAALAQVRFGNTAVRGVLTLLPEREQRRAVDYLRSADEVLRQTRYGRMVSDFVARDFSSCA